MIVVKGRKKKKKKAVETGREKVSHLYVSGGMAIDGEYDPAEPYGVY